MNHQIDRRHWLLSAAAAGAASPLGAKDLESPVPEAAKLTAYQRDGRIVLRWNNRAICAYRAHQDLRFPYFYPVAGPVTGAPLTSESSLPYPHHRSLYFACDKVNGVDYWHDKPLALGQIRSASLSFEQKSPGEVVIENRCKWIYPDVESPFLDERVFSIRVHNDKIWTISAQFTLLARINVVIRKNNHSLFAMRADPAITPLYGGNLVNANGGEGAEGTYGKPAAWCGFFGARAGGIVEGITMMQHPKNAWPDCPWFTRDYGFASPTPLNFIEKPWELQRGERVTFRYLVALHAGRPSEAGMDQVYEQWAGA